MNFSRDKVQNLGKDILDLFAVFESYDNQVIMSTTSSTRQSCQQSKDYFFSLITNKSSGHNDISKIVNKCFGNLCELLNISNLSLQKENLHYFLKVAKVTPVFKYCEKVVKSNYQTISLPN